MADPESQLDYLHRQIAERLARLESSTVWYRKLYVRGQMTTVVLSAVITIVAGLKSFSLVGGAASDVVLVLGALVMTAAAWAALFSPRESWHLNAATYTELRAQRRLAAARDQPRDTKAHGAEDRVEPAHPLVLQPLRSETCRADAVGLGRPPRRARHDVLLDGLYQPAFCDAASCSFHEDRSAPAVQFLCH